MEILEAAKIVEEAFDGLSCEEIILCIRNTEEETRFGEKPHYIKNLLLYKIGADVIRDAFRDMSLEDVIRCKEFAENIKNDGDQGAPYIEALAFYKIKKKEKSSTMNIEKAMEIINNSFSDSKVGDILQEL